MPACDSCNTSILFGGERHLSLRFCGKKCRQKGQALVDAFDRVTDAEVQALVTRIREEGCPLCHAKGPVDVHSSYRVLSFLVYVMWQSTPRIACRRCGLKRQAGDFGLSLLLGWWSRSGLFLTPVYLAKGFHGMVRPPDPGKPSDRLQGLARGVLAAPYLKRVRAGETLPPPSTVPGAPTAQEKEKPFVSEYRRPRG